MVPWLESARSRDATTDQAITVTLCFLHFTGCFLFCWIPFFTCNILSAISIKTSEDFLMSTMTIFMLTTWLGYVNSTLNPVIYTLFNHEFRKAFKKMIFFYKVTSGPEDLKPAAKRNTGLTKV